MNKEYDNNNKGSLWLADKVTSNGDQYYNGSITINNEEHKITMFENKSDNSKAPKFKITVNAFKKDEQKPFTGSSQVGQAVQEDPFAQFADSMDIDDSSLPF